eukprot:Hpha_TRINITY_DN18458_c0_g1::TRINITY_DN18458_c0_g1_i1::g.165412::m.165412
MGGATMPPVPLVVLLLCSHAAAAPKSPILRCPSRPGGMGVQGRDGNKAPPEINAKIANACPRPNSSVAALQLLPPNRTLFAKSAPFLRTPTAFLHLPPTCQKTELGRLINLGSWDKVKPIFDAPPRSTVVAAVQLAPPTKHATLRKLALPVLNEAGIVMLRDAAIVVPSGMVFNGTAALISTYTGKKLWYNPDKKPIYTLVHNTVVSLISDFDHLFTYFGFSMLPKVALVCGWLRSPRGKCAKLAVPSKQVKLYTKLFCPGLDEERFIVAVDPSKLIGAKRVYMPYLRHSNAAITWFYQGHTQITPAGFLIPTGSLQPSQSPSSVVWIGREATQVRHVANEDQILNAIRAALLPKVKLDTFGRLHYAGVGHWSLRGKAMPGTTKEESKNATNQEPWVDAMKKFGNAAVVVGPHGGAFANLIFARPDTKVIELGGEFLGDQMPSQDGMLYDLRRNGTRRHCDVNKTHDYVPRFCWLGLANALGLRYTHIRPVGFFSYSWGHFYINAGDVVRALPGKIIKNNKESDWD